MQFIFACACGDIAFHPTGYLSSLAYLSFSPSELWLVRGEFATKFEDVHNRTIGINLEFPSTNAIKGYFSLKFIL